MRICLPESKKEGKNQILLKWVVNDELTGLSCIGRRKTWLMASVAPIMVKDPNTA